MDDWRLGALHLGLLGCEFEESGDAVVVLCELGSVDLPFLAHLLIVSLLLNAIVNVGCGLVIEVFIENGWAGNIIRRTTAASKSKRVITNRVLSRQLFGPLADVPPFIPVILVLDKRSLLIEHRDLINRRSAIAAFWKRLGWSNGVLLRFLSRLLNNV